MTGAGPAGVPLVLAVTAAGGLVVAAAARGSLTAPLREGSRLLVQQRRRTPAPDAVLRWLAAGAVPVLAVLAAAVLPVLPGGRTYLSTSADLVWFNAMEALLWMAWWCAGFGANSVHALVGGYRHLAQGLAYELPLMFALITVGVGAGSLRVTDVVAAQQGLWFVVTMPVAALVLLASVAAFAAWGPFAAPLGRDVVGGAVAETSGLERLLLLGGRAAFVGVGALATATLFLGGPAGPLLPGGVWLALKAGVVAGLLVAASRLLPVLRPDRVTDVAWAVVLPLSVLQALVVSVLVLTGRL